MLTVYRLCIWNPSSKLFERIFCIVETKKHRSKISFYYTEKNFNFVRVFFKILYTLFTIDFIITKKYPSLIRKKIQVLLMCFQKKFINYFHTKRAFPYIFGQTSFYTCNWYFFKLIYTKNKTVKLNFDGTLIRRIST